MREQRALGVISHDVVFFAILFSAQFLVRTMLDWFMPTADFHARAALSTFLGAGILLAAGFWGAWRSGALTAGAISGVATASLAAVISVSGAAILLLVWHDPETMSAIRGSGGLQEVFSLPLLMILPGAVLGSIGGIACIATKKVLST
jgi:hypothetical protein